LNTEQALDKPFHIDFLDRAWEMRYVIIFGLLVGTFAGLFWNRDALFTQPVRRRARQRTSKKIHN